MADHASQSERSGRSSDAFSAASSATSGEGTTITRKAYWRKQLQYILILLAVWFIAGYVMSIFFVESLNAISFGGIPFGFWMAQQGSVFVFISLILIYALAAGRLDRQAGVAETEDATTTPGAGH